MATTDSHSHFYQLTQQRQANTAIDRWCRSLKVSRRRIERNPHFADLATLLMFDQHESWFNQEDKQIWTHCWQWVYSKELPLTLYHKRKLISIIDGIEYRHQAYKQRQRKRQHIQARLQRRQLAAV